MEDLLNALKTDCLDEAVQHYRGPRERAHAALLAAEELAEAAGLLRERLLSFELTGDGDQMCRDFIGHVEPAEDRMAAALSAYRKATEGEG